MKASSSKSPQVGGECAGCHNALPKHKFLVCSICKLKYDIECAGVCEKRFNLMEPSHKFAWKCPECCSKQPKFGNTHTPIRSHIACETDLSNVTMRTKQNKSTSQGCQNYVTEDTLREIIQQEFSSVINETIKLLVTTELRSINEKISSFQEAVNFFNSQFEGMKVTLDRNTKTIADLTKDNEKLKSSVYDLTTRLNTVELHMREGNLEINGIPEHRSENLYNTVVQLTKAVDNPLQVDDILHVTRVAKISKDNDKPRAVVAKLRSPRIRDIVLAAVKNFNKANSQDKLNSHHLGIGGTKSSVYVSEHLTSANKYLHAAARKKAKELAFKFVWVRNGRIFVRKDENHQSLLIRSLDYLNNLK